MGEKYKSINRLKERFEKDEVTFLKNRRAYSSNFPFDFEDYVEKYGDKEMRTKRHKDLWENQW